jgi:hypothetical protein
LELPDFQIQNERQYFSNFEAFTVVMIQVKVFWVVTPWHHNPEDQT